jgi:protoporphyrinogen oxidase
MTNSSNYILKECVVIGAGISGLAMARWLKVKQKLKK